MVGLSPTGHFIDIAGDLTWAQRGKIPVPVLRSVFTVKKQMIIRWMTELSDQEMARTIKFNVETILEDEFQVIVDEATPISTLQELVEAKQKTLGYTYCSTNLYKTDERLMQVGVVGDYACESESNIQLLVAKDKLYHFFNAEHQDKVTPLIENKATTLSSCSSQHNVDNPLLNFILFAPLEILRLVNEYCCGGRILPLFCMIKPTCRLLNESHDVHQLYWQRACLVSKHKLESSWLNPKDEAVLDETISEENDSVHLSNPWFEKAIRGDLFHLEDVPKGALVESSFLFAALPSITHSGLIDWQKLQKRYESLHSMYEYGSTVSVTPVSIAESNPEVPNISNVDKKNCHDGNWEHLAYVLSIMEVIQDTISQMTFPIRDILRYKSKNTSLRPFMLYAPFLVGQTAWTVDDFKRALHMRCCNEYTIAGPFIDKNSQEERQQEVEKEYKRMKELDPTHYDQFGELYQLDYTDVDVAHIIDFHTRRIREESNEIKLVEGIEEEAQRRTKEALVHIRIMQRIFKEAGNPSPGKLYWTQGPVDKLTRLRMKLGKLVKNVRAIGIHLTTEYPSSEGAFLIGLSPTGHFIGVTGLAWQTFIESDSESDQEEEWADY